MEIWAPTQTPDAASSWLPTALGIPREKVTLHQTRVGGGFGRRLMNDYMCEAAAISKQAGVPVKLQWTREDDMQHDFYRVGGFHSFKGGVDRAGKLVAWPDHFITFTPGRPEAGQRRRPQPGRISRAAACRTCASRRPSCRSRSRPGRGARRARTRWRSPCRGSCTNARSQRKRDHLEFLLEVMGEPRWLQPGNEFALNTGRAAAVIKLAAEKAGWGKPLPKGRGLGLAFHFSHAGHFAEVAEVSVDANRKLTVHRVTVAGDIGPIVNLSGAENQVEGSVVDGFSTALGLELSIRERPHPGDELRPLPDAAHPARAGGRRALHPERLLTDRRRRAGVAAGRAGDLQRDLRRNGASGADAAAEPAKGSRSERCRAPQRGAQRRHTSSSAGRRRNGRRALARVESIARCALPRGRRPVASFHKMPGANIAAGGFSRCMTS